jgi:TnpA family transposase
MTTESLTWPLSFGEIKRRAFSILERDKIMKVTRQSVIIAKLSSYPRKNRTKKALWELDNLRRSLAGSKGSAVYL